MSQDTLQTKRQNKKGGFRQLQAKVGKRKQRVSATATSSMDISGDVPSVGIGRALMIILVLHVVAIGAIFLGTKKNDRETLPALLADQPEEEKKPQVKSSQLNRGLERRVVKSGDNYTKLAKRYNVDTQELRRVNYDTPLSAGLFIYLPAKKVTVNEVITQTPKPPQSLPNPVSDRPDLGLGQNNAIDHVAVEEIGTDELKSSASDPAAVLITPKRNPNLATDNGQQGSVSDSGKTYKVKAGDSIWRIAHNHKVNQESLLKLNGLSDPRKLRAGMVLKIPN